MKTLLSLIPLFALTACASLTPSTWEPSSNNLSSQHFLTKTQRYQQLSALTQWNANGSIAIHNYKKGWNASFVWQQQNAYHYTLQLFGPLGSNRIQLDSQPGKATLQTAQQTYSAPTTEALLEQELGYELPTGSLSYWLRGLTVPKIRSSQAYTMSNHIAELNQEGWHVMYLRYVTIGNVDLPQRILLTKQPWVAHIIIHHWELQ